MSPNYRALVLALCLVASCRDARQRGDPCEASAECAAPLVCLVHRKCGKLPPPLICPENGKDGCFTHPDCNAESVCSSRCCRRICSVDQDCDTANRERCDVGVCIKEICSAQSDCNDPAQVCRAGGCVAAPDVSAV